MTKAMPVRVCAALVCSLAITSLAQGCLRRRFDLCSETPAHPECPPDAGRDASVDAALPEDAGSADANSVDGGPDAPLDDAPAVFAPDAAEIPDAAETRDAGADASASGDPDAA